MKFGFNEEQAELKELVAGFIAARWGEMDLMQAANSEFGYDPEVWNLVCDQMALPALAIPEQWGGAGFGWTEVGVAMEEMGRGLLCGPFFSGAVLSAAFLLHAAGDAARGQLLPGIAAGEQVVTVAVPSAGSWAPGATSLTARRTPGGWAVDGEEPYVIDGEIADTVILLARDEDGALVLLGVDGNDPGLTRQAQPVVDPTRRLARLNFAGAAATELGSGEGLERGATTALNIASAMLAAEVTGCAARMLAMSVEYAKERKQFGRPIGSFQAIKHKCASMLVAVESMRAAAYYAIWAAGSSPDEVLDDAVHVSMSYCGDSAAAVAREAIQIHGGIGVTWEHPLHLYFKRVRGTYELFGSPDAHLDRLATASGF